MKKINRIILSIIEVFTYICSSILIICEFSLGLAGIIIIFGKMFHYDFLIFDSWMSQQSVFLIIISWIIAGIILLNYFLISVFTRRIIRNIKQHSYFCLSNLNNIRYIIYNLGSALFLQILSQGIFNIMHVKNVSDVYISGSTLCIYILVLMILYVIYQVFQYGLELKTDNEKFI